ncbi:ISNCY family transposase, partial [Escherichia coli]|nr:ISNCY family transposase [Escherichia coli]
GIEKGIDLERQETARRLQKMGMSFGVIKEATQLPDDVLKKILH